MLCVGSWVVTETKRMDGREGLPSAKGKGLCVIDNVRWDPEEFVAHTDEPTDGW